MKCDCPRCGAEDFVRTRDSVLACGGCWVPVMDDIYPEIMKILNEVVFEIDMVIPQTEKSKKLSSLLMWVRNWMETLYSPY